LPVSLADSIVKGAKTKVVRRSIDDDDDNYENDIRILVTANSLGESEVALSNSHNYDMITTVVQYGCVSLQ